MPHSPSTTNAHRTAPQGKGPNIAMRLFLAFWSALWTFGLPLIWLYLKRRARKAPDYSAHFSERLGRYPRAMPGAIWIHAVSLGEMRSAIPLIEALLEEGAQVVITHFTPAGRREAQSAFATQIARGQVQSVWVPLETSWAWRGFWRSFRPRYGLVMEIEIWPRMVFAARAAGVPLYMCNAQYPRTSLRRDSRGLFRLRQAVMRGFTGAFVKSDLQATRFANIGVSNITVTGELRFDQPVPEWQVAAGVAARAFIDAQGRRVIVIASSVENEDETYITAIHALRAAPEPPVIIYVPRRPERFDEVAQTLSNAGLKVQRRSALFSAKLHPRDHTPQASEVEILLGDSLGEMYFYLAMADIVVVGGGFNPKGAHNISEAIALGKAVIVGPHTGTIEYPFEEASAAGVALCVQNAHELVAALSGEFAPSSQATRQFFLAHSGASAKTRAALPQ